MNLPQKSLQTILSKLPAPPSGSIGWPWTADNIYDVCAVSGAATLPKITVVTPTLNQGEFLEETIRSVILQDYPNLEFIVIDGGSTDGSVDILRKYTDWIDSWVSEPDRGQTHAINKGFTRATGAWLTWLNSDDVLLPGSIWKVAEAVSDNQEADWIVGSVVVTDQSLNPIRKFEPVCNTDDWMDFLCNKRKAGTSIPQPGTYWSRSAGLAAGELDESLQYVMDYEYWVRLAMRGYRPLRLSEELALFRLNAKSKSGGGMAKFIREEQIVVAKYLKERQVNEPLRVFFYKVFLKQIWQYRIASNKAKCFWGNLSLMLKRRLNRE